MDQSPLFSVVVATAREDKPFIHHHDWHVLDKIVECCDKQTFRDFELIVVDILHEQRPNYFSGIKAGFPILHIPDKKTPFKDFKLTRICAARNTGIMYARGSFVITGDDGEEWSPDAFDRFSMWAKRKLGASGRLYRDKGSEIIGVDSRYKSYGIPDGDHSKIFRANSTGYLGGTLTMTPMPVMLRCNGFDEMFDGSRQLEDADLAYRFGAAGLRVALDGAIRVVEYDQKKWDTNRQFFRDPPFTKCNGAYFYPIIFGKGRGRIVANNKQLGEEEVATFIKGKCRKMSPNGNCTISKDTCLGKWKWGHPEDDLAFLVKIYRDSRLVFNLHGLRSARRWETVHEDPLLF